MATTSRTNRSYYHDRIEMTVPGLHKTVFTSFRRHVPVGANVLDLGSGAGAWCMRLVNGGYRVVATGLHERLAPFPFRRIDLNGCFSSEFDSRFDAVTCLEVIEHVENPRHLVREAHKLLRPGGVLVLSTPNASGLYSRVRFFFTGQHAQFTDEQYVGSGHISPVTHWQLSQIMAESHFCLREVTYYDSRFLPPRRIQDVAKLFAWIACRPFMRGPVGGQIMIAFGQAAQ